MKIKLSNDEGLRIEKAGARYIDVVSFTDSSIAEKSLNIRDYELINNPFFCHFEYPNTALTPSILGRYAVYKGNIIRNRSMATILSGDCILTEATSGQIYIQPLEGDLSSLILFDNTGNKLFFYDSYGWLYRLVTTQNKGLSVNLQNETFIEETTYNEPFLSCVSEHVNNDYACIRGKSMHLSWTDNIGIPEIIYDSYYQSVFNITLIDEQYGNEYTFIIISCNGSRALVGVTDGSGYYSYSGNIYVNNSFIFSNIPEDDIQIDTNLVDYNNWVDEDTVYNMLDNIGITFDFILTVDPFIIKTYNKSLPNLFNANDFI